MAENQYGFPTEVLSLPSQGLLYPEDSPLRSGTIDVKYMTAKEEDILTSVNLINQGKVIDKLLESVIADPKVKLDDMLVGDKNALMVGTRVLGYGKEYKITLNDPDTNERVEHSVDLTSLKHLSFEDVDEKKFPSINLARIILKTKGSLGVVFNAAKEIALDRFISNDIKFLDMSNLVEKVLQLPEMNEYEYTLLDSIDEIISLNNRARQLSEQIRI